MLLKNETVNDPTDTSKTLCPNLLLEPRVGTHFNLILCLDFDY